MVWLTSPTASHHDDRCPTKDLEEVIRARDEAESIPERNAALSGSFRTK